MVAKKHTNFVQFGGKIGKKYNMIVRMSAYLYIYIYISLISNIAYFIRKNRGNPDDNLKKKKKKKSMTDIKFHAFWPTLNVP